MPTQTRKSDRRRQSKSPGRKSRSRSRSRSRGRSKSPARSKAKASPSPSRRSPARQAKAKPETPATPTRTSARIAQKEQDKEQIQVIATEVKASKNSPKKVAKVEKVSSASSVSKFIHGIGGPLFSTFAILALPWMVLSFNMACTKASCSYKNLSKMPKDLDSYFNKEAFAVYVGFLVLQALLMFLPVGKVVQGFPNSKGKVLSYRCNGLLSLVLTLGAMAIASYLKVSFAFVTQHLIHLIVAGSLVSFVLSLFLYIRAGRTAAADLNEECQTGCTPFDFFLGKEINPRIGSFDFKAFSIRSSIIGCAALLVVLVLESQSTSGDMNLPLIVVTASLLFTLTDVLWFESALSSTMVVSHEGTGFQTMFGNLVFGPFIGTLGVRFLLEHPQTWSYAALAGFLVLYLVGYVICRGSNSQKDQFRRNPNDPALSHLETIPSPSGKRLLASGWWGLVRHPNYLGDLIISLAITLPCGFNYALPYAYAAFAFTFLIHRIFADDKLCRSKHGAAWDRYCQRVKYRMIPYVF